MVVAAAGPPSMRLDSASSTERSVAKSRRLATGIDALATHSKVAEISAGGSAGRRAGLNAQPYSAERRASPSGLPRRFVSRARVTVVLASAVDLRDFAAARGDRKSV